MTTRKLIKYGTAFTRKMDNLCMLKTVLPKELHPRFRGKARNVLPRTILGRN
jgi:hypothetical protein